MRLSSPAFEDGGRIPETYTCQGDDVSPPLVVEDVPDGAISLALIVDDPDAPRGAFDHWILWNLPADLRMLPAEIPPDPTVAGLGAAAQGENDFGRIGWGGPCPPPGRPHRYRFHLYALDAGLSLNPGSARDRLEAAMEGHIVAEAELVGTFGR
ncbi:MAG TPA: YbhB/YbcL family Raf kinase inhibitor-like protein [Longimicrobiales bacterium]